MNLTDKQRARRHKKRGSKAPFPNTADIDSARKLAMRVDPLLAELMDAQPVNTNATAT